MTGESSKFFPVSWEELHRNAKALAWRLLELGPWTGIVAVTRGGLVPAAIVARELDIRHIETACISSYRGDKEGQGASGDMNVIKLPADAGDGTGWLVVDDLVDTGRTIEFMRQKYPKAHYATVYAKPSGRPMVDTFITEVSQDTWIYFPWDIELQFKHPIVKSKNG